MASPDISATPESTLAQSESRRLPDWCRPTISPEHGVYIVLLVAFLIGAAVAQQWTWTTTLALICAFCGFQAEHPLVVQIRQRKSWKPRFVVWGSIYGGIAMTIALYLYWQTGSLVSPLLGIYSGAIGALIVDSISVFYREQKAIWNEFLTFAAVCLATPFVYIVTTNQLTGTVLGLWLLNTLFFSSAIFTVKLRKFKSNESLVAAIQRVVVYHLVATALVVGLLGLGVISLWTALPFSIVLVKVSLILWQRQWYCTTRIQSVAMLETTSALAFGVLTALSVLPVHLPH
ncbi:YwiC-like family protein [Pantanalinema sp. GBBB05]|uniref:YwiC-like family protein n=1 Tax=Pantanalinema sp. GBBB05 TaxID=2604139 RepID=UPI001D97B962|nr:YwiC-like family protein [Pantanalinema sp. GBBB05]